MAQFPVLKGKGNAVGLHYICLYRAADFDFASFLYESSNNHSDLISVYSLVLKNGSSLAHLQLPASSVNSSLFERSSFTDQGLLYEQTIRTNVPMLHKENSSILNQIATDKLVAIVRDANNRWRLVGSEQYPLTLVSSDMSTEAGGYELVLVSRGDWPTLNLPSAGAPTFGLTHKANTASRIWN